METLQALSPGDQTHRGKLKGISDEERNLSKDGLAVSEEEYWEKYYNDPDFVYEWKNGCLEVMPMSDVKGSRSHRWFCGIMDCYLRTHPVGTAVSLEIGFRLDIPNETDVRIPDLAVVLNDNPVPVSDDDCRYSGTFDLCVESLSHSSQKEIRRDTVHKKREYESAGVGEYYILDARKLETAFYRLDRRGRYEKMEPVSGDVIRSGVLPGFQFRISDLYRRPSLEDLAEDEVYKDYVLLSYQEARQEAETERLRAELAEKVLISEQQKLEEEKRRADRLAEKLRALGIDPESLGEGE